MFLIIATGSETEALGIQPSKSLVRGRGNTQGKCLEGVYSDAS